VFLDYGLLKYVRGQVGIGYGKIVGRYYSSTLLPIDYRFLIIPYNSRGFSPYGYMGIGGLHYDVDVGAARKSAGVETTGWVAFMPGGVGFVSQLSDRLALDFNVGYNIAFSDDVNGHKGSSENDSYYSGHFGVRLPLASKTSAEREQEELQAKLAAEEQQRKAAELKAAEDQQRKELEAKRAADEKRLKEEEARKAEEAQKALEAKKAQEAQKPAEPVVAKPEPPKEVQKEIVFEPVYFHIGGSMLTASERTKLDAAVKTLKEYPGLSVAVSGHTDNTGSRLINEKLSEARANVVRTYLIKKGISGERITAKGYSFDKPASSNDTIEGRRLNRRSELEVVK